MTVDRASAKHDLLGIVTGIPWIASLSKESRDWLLGEMQLRALKGGETLFVAGSDPDALYILVSGSLGAFAPDSAQLIGQVVAGETVGERGLITNRPRNATVRALRDSELLHMSRATFDVIMQLEPEALRPIVRQVLERMEAYRSRAKNLGPRTIALLPQTEGLDAKATALHMSEAFSRFGSCLVVAKAQGQDRDSAWFAQMEALHRFVIYVAEPEEDDWRELCRRQADALVFLVASDATVFAWSELIRGVGAPLPRPEHLVIVHKRRLPFGDAKKWQSKRPRAMLHHLRDAKDAARLARLAVGRGMGLVLSGGGARGFAHIGVVKALREAGITIDAVGGTSIGAVIGAGIAADWSVEEMVFAYHRAFVATNPLSDYTLPLVSLVSGRKVSRLLREAFGERDVEDLILPFFCVTANLSDQAIGVHHSGPLWQWLRATVAIPGILPPVFQRGQVYVDGGVINNLPVDVMRDKFPGEVIAVDISGDHPLAVSVDEFNLPAWWRLIPELFRGRKRPGILEVLVRAGMVNSGASAAAARNASTLLLKPPLHSVNLLEWHKFATAIDIGYQYTLRIVGGEKDALSTNAPLL